MSAPASTTARSGDELDPDEPRTPLWLPLLGLCLFVAGLAYGIATNDAATPAEGSGGEENAEGAAR
jgi:hypothetical protein